MTDPIDHAQALAIHEELRAYLIRTHAHEAPQNVMFALMYELVSVIASLAETEAQAIDVLRRTCHVGEHQVEEFGVGGPHP
jgi:hypothetical protein